MKTKERKAILFAGLAGCMWGTIGLFVNWLHRFEIESLELTVSRLVISVILLGFFLLLFQRKLLKIRLRDLPGFFVAGVCCLLLFNVSYGLAIERSSMSMAAVLLYTSPAFVTAISVVVFKEKCTIRKGVAVLLAVLGCAFVSGIMRGILSFPLSAYLWGLCSAISYAAYSITAGKLLKRYHPATVLFYAFLTAAFAGSFLVEFGEIGRRVVQEPVAGAALLLAALICNLFSYLCYNLALKDAPASHVAVAASIEPAAASVLGLLVLKERIDVFGVIGILCILCAILVQNWERREKAHAG